MNFENRFTGRAVGDFLLGLPSQLALTSFTVMDQGQSMYFGFLQDDWKVTSRFTLNLGIRYEFATPPLEKNNQFANFDPATGTMKFAKDGSLYDRSLIHPDANDWAPRVGFAYSLRLSPKPSGELPSWLGLSREGSTDRPASLDKSAKVTKLLLTY